MSKTANPGPIWGGAAPNLPREDCSSDLDAGAVAIIGANAAISASTFKRCTARGTGGALWAVGLQTYDVLEPLVPAELHVHANCVFEHNWAVAMGGAVACIQQSNCTMQDSTFTSNMATTDNLPASDSAFTNPQRGGAVAFSLLAHGVVSDCQFHSNSADVGGAMSISEKSIVTVDASHFSSNTATTEDGQQGSGGALDVSAQSTVSIEHSDFDDNTAKGLGGGAMSMTCISCPSGAVTDVSLFANKFRRNSAPNGGGGAVLWNHSAQELRVRRACEPGWYAVPGSDGREYCSRCPAGSYKESVTAQSCTLCEPGKFSNVEQATTSNTCMPHVC